MRTCLLLHMPVMIIFFSHHLTSECCRPRSDFICPASPGLLLTALIFSLSLTQRETTLRLHPYRLQIVACEAPSSRSSKICALALRVNLKRMELWHAFFFVTSSGKRPTPCRLRFPPGDSFPFPFEALPAAEHGGHTRCISLSPSGSCVPPTPCNRPSDCPRHA